METPKEKTGGGLERGKKSTEEMQLLEQIRKVNDERHRLEAECIVLHRGGRLNEFAKKRRAVKEARRYLNILCAKHRTKFRRRKPYIAL